MSSTPAKDIAACRQTIGEILDTIQPAILVVENEEPSSVFWAGTPEEYEAELRAACEEAHQRNIPCANGGMVSEVVGLVVWARYVELGQHGRSHGLVRDDRPARQRHCLALRRRPRNGRVVSRRRQGTSPPLKAPFLGAPTPGMDADGAHYVGMDRAGKMPLVRQTSPTSGEMQELPTPPDLTRRAIYPTILPEQRVDSSSG